MAKIPIRFRRKWAYSLTIFGIFALSLGSSLLLQHLQDAQALSLIDESLKACKADIFLTFFQPFTGMIPTMVPLSFDRIPYYKAIIDFFGKDSFNKTSLLFSLGKRIAVRNVPDPTPKQLEMYLPKGYSYEFHRFLFTFHDSLKVSDKVQVAGVHILILNDTDPTLVSLSKLFKVNFSQEALYLEDFSEAKADGIYGMNGKVVEAFVPGMNSTISAKMAFVRRTEVTPWEIYKIWEAQGLMFVTSPSVLVLSKSYFLRENKYTFEGVYGLGVFPFLIGYEITVKGLGYCPFLQGYLNKISSIESSLLEIGGFVYAPKVATIIAALNELHSVVLMTNIGISLTGLIASLATVTVAVSLMRSTKGEVETLLQGKGKKKALGKCLAIIFIPLAISLALFLTVEFLLAINLRIFLLTYFPSSTALSLGSFLYFLQKHYKENKNELLNLG